MELSNLQKYLESIVDNNVAPGVDCLVKKDGKSIFRFCYGYGDIENKTSINGNEEYLIFSMTKLFTCVCALRLLEQNKYSLDDPIERYLPEFADMEVVLKPASDVNQNDIATGKSLGEKTVEKTTATKLSNRSITVRQLFTMGAGFNYNLQAKNIIDAVESGAHSTRDIVASFSKVPLEFEPGTHFRYSLCHDVLGALIEVWSGKKFGEYLKENICIPLGLEHTYFSKRYNSDNKKLPCLYIKNADGLFVKQPLINPYTIADGYESGGAGLISCTSDYSAFIDALANDGIAYNGHRVLKSETVDLMKTNQLNEEQYNDFQALRAGYGYGLGVRTHMYPDVSASLSPVGEFGWDGAAGAFSVIDTANHISLTYFQHCFSWEVSTQHSIRNALYKSLNLS